MTKTFATIFAVTLLALSLSVKAVYAATSESGKINLSIDKDAVLDGPTLAYELVHTFMSEDEWKKEVAKIRSKFEDWERDSRGDMGQYLNDRLIMVAMSAAGGEAEKIQRGMVWLAFYKEFNQPAHPQVQKFLREHRGTTLRLLMNFSWERASQYIKTKEWREDLKPGGVQVAAAPKPVPPVVVAKPEVQPVTTVRPVAKPQHTELVPVSSAPRIVWLDRAAQRFSRPEGEAPDLPFAPLIPLSTEQ